jgi:hypothetical protein
MNVNGEAGEASHVETFIATYEVFGQDFKPLSPNVLTAPRIVSLVQMPDQAQKTAWVALAWQGGIRWCGHFGY